jgi:uncharacterized protein YfaS (alpha-2-macroglobulin family)
MAQTVDGVAAPRFVIDPPVSGTARWTDPYRLVFDFDETPPSATRFEVHAVGDLVTADGEPVALERRWSFETPRPAVEVQALERYWDSDDTTQRRQWKTKFSISVLGEEELSPAKLRGHVVARARPVGGGEPQIVPVTVRRPTQSELDEYYQVGLGDFIVQPRGHWPADRVVSVTVDENFRASGPLPTGRAVGAEVVTDAGLGIELSCGVDNGDGCDPGWVRLHLSRPVPARALKALTVTPRPKKLKIRFDYDDGSGDQVMITGEFESHRSYRIAASSAFRDIFGQAPVEPLSADVDFVDPPPMVTLSDTRGTLPATGARTVGLETRWVERVRLRMAVLEDRQLLAQMLREPDDLRIPADARRIVDETIDMTITGELGWASHVIDLAAMSGGERRAVLVEATPITVMKAARGRPAPTVARGLFQQTDLGVVAVVSPSRSVARVTQLSTAAPTADIGAELFRGTFQVPAKHLRDLGETDRGGLVELPRSTALPKRGLVLVHTASDDDRAVVRVGEAVRGEERRAWWWSSGPYDDGDELRSELATERPLYRPGEQVKVVGWAAVSTNHTMSGLRPPKAGAAVELRLEDFDGEVIDRHAVRMKPYGKYWGSLDVPAEAALGGYRVVAEVDEQTFQTFIRVRDFRTPTFEVRAVADRGDLRWGESVGVNVAASYYFGGRVPIETLRRGATCRRNFYRPPGLDRTWVLATRDFEDLRLSVRSRYDGPPEIPEEDKREGRAHLIFGSGHLPTGASFACTADIAISDRSLEDVGAEAQWLVHPPAYLALARPREPLHRGDRARVAVRTVDYAGERIAGGAVKIEVTRHWWGEADGDWTQRTEVVEQCRVTPTARRADASCAVDKVLEGRYEVTARFDSTESPVAQTSFWVGPRRRPSRAATTANLAVEVEPEHPKPGELAQVRISTGRANGPGIVVLSHGGVRRIEPFVVVDHRAELELTVDQSWVPALQVDALLAEGGSRPSMLHASTHVSVPEHGRELSVEVDAPATAAPDTTISIDLHVRDSAGHETEAHVSVWAVDEAVLSLAEPVIPDLVDAFIVNRRPRVSIEHDYDEILQPYVAREDPYAGSIGLGNIGTIGKGGGGGTGSGFGSGSGRGPAPARGRFETTPIFIGDVHVGPSGDATVEGRMPENLSTFRITAIAAAKLPGSEAAGRFGHGEARTRVTVPLALRVITPRILRPGDEAELAALVDNLGGPAGTVSVSMVLVDAKGELRVRDGAEKTATIAAGGQVRLPFSVTAVEVGEPAVEMRVTLTPDDSARPSLHDAMRVPLPVQRERTLVRRQAVYGSLADDVPRAVAIEPPRKMIRGSGRVEVRLDSSLLAGLQDVAKYLIDYPYGCIEQTSSSMVPLVALGELSSRYPLGIEDVSTYFDHGVARLRAMQTDSGGFGYWPGAQQPHLYGTAYAAWVLELAGQGGMKVPPGLRRRALDYLHAEVEAWAKRDATGLRDDVPIAMALHALSYDERAPAAAAVDRMFELHAQAPVFVHALLVMTLHRLRPDDARIEPLVAGLEARLQYSAGAATVAEQGASFPQFFDSGSRTSAMVLLALVEVRPDHAAVEPLARGVMALRAKGRIRNTQENAYALLGLAAYARHYESETPDLVARAWIGDEPAVDENVTGAGFSTLRAERDVAGLAGAKVGSRVTLQREGAGRLYYRVGMAWSPSDAGEHAVAAGLAVQTELRGAGGVLGEGETIAPGTLLALDVTVTSDARVDYVAVDIPLPAGLEAVDRSIGKGRRAMTIAGVRGGWVSHEEIRKDRAVLFADSLGAGAVTHTVYLRATSAGSFEMPPTVAESMYFPEIHGHTKSRRVRVASPP